MKKFIGIFIISSGIAFCAVPLPHCWPCGKPNVNNTPGPHKPKEPPRVSNIIKNHNFNNYKLNVDGTPPPQPPSCFPYCGGMHVPIIIELHQDKKNNKLAEMPIPDPKCPYMPTIKGNCPGRPQPI